MSNHERTLAVIQKFYEASMDEALWPSALKDLADLTESQAASFWVLDGSDKPRLPTFICINFDMERIKEYLEHTAAIDPTTSNPPGTPGAACGELQLTVYLNGQTGD